MANGIKTYSTTPASNTALFPENMAPSAVNDGMRQVEADIRSWFEDAEWADWGDTPSRASASSFKIATDVTSRYTVNRRIKMYDASTLYGTIATSSYGAPDTTIGVTMDSGSLTASLSSVALGILSPTNQSIPAFSNLTTTGNLTVGGTASISGASVFKTSVTIEGTATCSATFVAKSSIVCDGALIESKGTASTAGRLRLYEDSDNGSNYIEVIATASIAANRTQTLPDTDISCYVVQRVSTETGAVATGSTNLPYDNSIPQNTEGDEYMTLAITPKNSSNILVIDVVAQLTHSVSGNALTAALFQDTTANALAAAHAPCIYTAAAGTTISFRHIMSAGTTSATTFKVRAGSGIGSGTTTFNGQGGGRVYGGVAASSMMITEYSA
jgi:hypothetical protein